MTDDKIINMASKKPFELVTGTEGTSPEQIIVLLQRFLKYAAEKKFMAVGIVMVDEKHSSITGFHMEEGMGTTLVGAASYLELRINKHMDEE
jgi:hypothetical protein